MKIHLSERDPQHHAWATHGVEGRGMRLRILLSYWYYKDADLDALFAKYFTQPYPDVFADSGAFSSATQGVTIGVDDYAAWVRRWGHLFSVYANLDSIGDHGGTTRNQEALEAQGLSPLPVFHVSAAVDYSELDRLCDRYRYIALGGMVPYARTPERLLPHLIRCFRIAEGRAVFHGFGCTSWTILKALPWYSVDSSAWGSGFRYGNVPVFDEVTGRFVTVRLGDGPAWAKVASVVRQMGFDPLDFADRKRNDRAKICGLSAVSYMMTERWLRRRHGEIRIPGGAPSAPAGLRAHLADANPTRFGDAVQGAGVRLHLADTSNGINYGDAERGIRLHLADARGHSGSEIASAVTGLRIHLAEHSLDRGGVGDTSRAMEALRK